MQAPFNCFILNVLLILTSTNCYTISTCSTQNNFLLFALVLSDCTYLSHSFSSFAEENRLRVTQVLLDLLARSLECRRYLISVKSITFGERETKKWIN